VTFGVGPSDPATPIARPRKASDAPVSLAVIVRGGGLYFAARRRYSGDPVRAE